jgi:IS4 transposase
VPRRHGWRGNAWRARPASCKRNSADDLELRPSIAVWTTLPETFSAPAVLALYRLRWQIELAIKRMQSILGLGHLPKKDPASARAWLHGKLSVSLLVERMVAAANSFSPWGYRLDAETKPMEGN